MIYHYNQEEKFTSYSYKDDMADLPVQFQEIGRHNPPSGHSFGPAVRDYYLIHIVMTGKGYFIKDNVRYELTAGDCFLIRPMEVTVYGTDTEDPWSYYWIAFCGKNADSLARYVFSDSVCVAKAGESAVREIISMFKYVSANSTLGALDATSKLYSVLSLLKDSVNPDDRHVPDLTEQAIRYMEANFFRDIKISALAKELGVTRSYFSSVFTGKTGLSPYEYLIDFRIEKAKTLLENSDLNISEIAYSVGFAGIERFSSMFRGRVGINPVAYRKQKRR